MSEATIEMSAVESSQIREHAQNEEPVRECDCRRCALAERDRLRDENERMARVIRSYDLGGKPLEMQIAELRRALSEIAEHHEHQRDLWDTELGDADTARYHEERRNLALFHLVVPNV